MSLEPRQHWLIYALGGGLGHVTRATGLIRSANQAGVTCTLMVNSPLLPLVPLADELGSSNTLMALDHRLDGPAVGRCVHELLQAIQPTRFVVDTFPRGLGGELAEVASEIRCPSVLIHRDLNPQYVQEFRLNEYVSKHFDLVLVPGEQATLQTIVPTIETTHWLIRDAQELLSPSQARLALLSQSSVSSAMTHSERPLVLVMATGQPHEIREMHELAEHLMAAVGDCVELRVGSLVEPQSLFVRRCWLPTSPLLPLLPGVDLLIGAGGYNTIAEARAVGVPLIGFARQRLYDRQARRLHSDECLANVDDLVDRVRSARRRDAARSVQFVNGTHSATDAIMKLQPLATRR